MTSLLLPCFGPAVRGNIEVVTSLAKTKRETPMFNDLSVVRRVSREILTHKPAEIDSKSHFLVCARTKIRKSPRMLRKSVAFTTWINGLFGLIRIKSLCIIRPNTIIQLPALRLLHSPTPDSPCAFLQHQSYKTIPQSYWLNLCNVRILSSPLGASVTDASSMSRLLTS